MKYFLLLSTISLFFSCSQPDVKTEPGTMHAMDTAATAASLIQWEQCKASTGGWITATLWGLIHCIQPHCH
jgi:hypothetical protein